MVVQRFIHVGLLQCSRDVTFLSRIDCPRQDQCLHGHCDFLSRIDCPQQHQCLHGHCGCARFLFHRELVPPRTLWVRSLPLSSGGGPRFLPTLYTTPSVPPRAVAILAGPTRLGKTNALCSGAGVHPGLLSTHSCGPIVCGMLERDHHSWVRPMLSAMSRDQAFALSKALLPITSTIALCNHGAAPVF